jgi:hypothetical protein
MGTKRRGAPLDSVPEAKRAASASAGGSAKPAAAAPAAAAPATGPAVGEENWDDIAARTGMSLQDALSRRLLFKKGTLPAKKLEEMGPVIKELK